MDKKIGFRVIEDIERPSKELLDRIKEFSTPELCDGTIVYNAMD